MRPVVWKRRNPVRRARAEIRQRGWGAPWEEGAVQGWAGLLRQERWGGACSPEQPTCRGAQKLSQTRDCDQQETKAGTHLRTLPVVQREGRGQTTRHFEGQGRSEDAGKARYRPAQLAWVSFDLATLEW